MTNEVAQQKVEPTLAQPDAVLPRLLVLESGDRLPSLIVYLQEQLAQALGINPAQLDPQQPLNYLGLDSLIAVKLRNRLRTDLKVDILAVKFMEDTTIADLAIQVSERLTNQGSSLSASPSKTEELLEGEL
ncbi:MAG TPA: acyl carrier protein [Leptolyngbyaceae cyanobacterium]